MKIDANQRLWEALLELQRVFRVNGLQWLAVFTPLGPVHTADELHMIEVKLATVRKLMALRKPSPAQLEAIKPAIIHVNALVRAVKAKLR